MTTNGPESGGITIGLATPTSISTATVHLYGYIIEQGGGPIASVGGDIWDEDYNNLGQVGTDNNGLYNLTLPWHSEYHIRFTKWIDNSPFAYHLYLPAEISINPGITNEVRTDVSLVPCANIILYLYDQAGNEVRYAAVSSTSNRYIFATDANDLPVLSALNAVQDPFFHDHNNDFALALPSMLVAPETRVYLHLQWTVPQVGVVIMDIDNAGTGYLTPGSGGYMLLNINREAARSEVNRLNREHTLFTSQGYAFSATVDVKLTLAQAALIEGEDHLNATPPDIASAVKKFDEALTNALLAQETIYLEKAQADIPRYRQGTLALSVEAADGQPIPGASITYQQITRDFLFSGGNLTDGWSYNPERGNLMNQMGVNAGAIGASYGLIEPTAGVYDWSYIDTYSGLIPMENMNFSINGAVAYYAYPDSWECPDYWHDLTFVEYKELLFNHFKNLAAHYGSRIGPWMLNEQNVTNCLNLSWEQRLEVYQTVMDGLYAGNPSAQNLITALAMPYGWGVEPVEAGSTDLPFSISFPIYLETLRQHSLPIDNIGLEFHFFGVSVPEGGSFSLPGMTLASLARLMDRYDGYGVPLWIEPFQVPSEQETGSAWWHRPWDQATQADFAVDFYTLAFSRQNMHDICWSDASDQNPFIVSAGLLDSNNQPKQAYYALRELITSWTTDGTGTTDENGLFVMRGYAGDYMISITNPNGSQFQSKVHIHEQAQAEVTITNPITYAIYGNSGGAGVTLTYFVGSVTKTVVSDKNGRYSIIVPYGWSGKVIPSKKCFIGRNSLTQCYFTPTQRVYTNVQSNQVNQNFVLKRVY